MATTLKYLTVFYNQNHKKQKTKNEGIKEEKIEEKRALPH